MIVLLIDYFCKYALRTFASLMHKAVTQGSRGINTGFPRDTVFLGLGNRPSQMTATDVYESRIGDRHLNAHQDGGMHKVKYA
jgi:hypothetical protein